MRDVSCCFDHCVSPRFVICIAAAILLIRGIAPEPSPAAENRLDKLTVHGFMTQVYAWTNGAQIGGIPEDGTTDYRDVAFQFGYEMSEKDRMVVQFAHSRKGKSPTAALNEDLQVDWAFYEHQFSDSASVRVGRVPLPAGIYNEIRDVGTILPFYVPPFSVYQDISFTSEAIDGLVVAKTIEFAAGWSLDADLYLGGWSTIESFSGLGLASAEAEDAVGLQLWLGTPVNGLRFGLGVNRYDVSGGVTRLEDKDTWESLYLSVDGDFDRVVFRAELYRRIVNAQAFGIPLLDAEADAYYFQLGFRLSDRWSLWGQVDFQTLDAKIPGAPIIDLWEDYAVSLSYAFNTNLLLRGEYHFNEGYWVEDRPANVFADLPTETEYGLLSLAVSF